MAEVDVVESPSQANVETSREFSPRETSRLFSLAPTLESLKTLKRNFATLIVHARDLGGIIDEKYHNARIATASGILALTTAACSQGEADVKITPLEPEYQPTASSESMEELPSTQTPILDTRQPALTPVETQPPAIEPTPPPAGGPTPEPTPTPTTESITNTSIYSLLKDSIQSQNSPLEEKGQLLEVIDKLEYTEIVLSNFTRFYNKHSPSISDLLKSQYGSLDFSNAFPTMNHQQAQDFLTQNEIFFLGDTTNLKGIKSRLDQILKTNPDTIPSELKRINNDYIGIFSTDYQKIGSETKELKSLNITVDPEIEKKPEFAQKIERVKSAINSTLEQIPNFQKLGLNFFIADVGSSGFFPEENKIVITVNTFEKSLKETIAEEIVHSQDIFFNGSKLLPHLTPEEIVSLIGIREQINSQTFPLKIESVLNSQKSHVWQKFAAGELLSAEELKILAAIEVHKRILDEIKIFDSLIDAQSILEYSFRGSKVNTYESISKFLEAESGRINQLSQKNYLIKTLVEDIRRRPELYDLFWTSVSPAGEKIGYNLSQKAWWSAFLHMARLFAIDKAYNGQIQLTPSQIKEFIDFQKQMSIENFAKILSYEILYSNKIPNPSESLGQQYLNIILK